MDKDYQPCNPDVTADRISNGTIYDDDEDWNQSSPPSVLGIEPKDFLSNVESSTEETSEGLKDGDTPALSPLITEAIVVTEDSGCDLQFELFPSTALTADEMHGKEQLFTKLLTGIDKDSGCTPSPPSSPQMSTQTVGTINEQRHLDPTDHDHPMLPASTATFSDMVAHRILVASDSSAPSSGYGTTDGYNYSTDASEISREYYARKLQEVDEIAEQSDSIHESINSSSEDNVPATTDQELTPFNASNQLQDNIPETLPSLLVTSAECSADTTSISSTQTPNLNIVNSSSTGDISCGSSYYRDKEGYLHMAPLNTGLNPRFDQQSSEDLPKSL